MARRFDTDGSPFSVPRLVPLNSSLSDETLNQEIAKARDLLDKKALFAALSRLGVLECASEQPSDDLRTRIAGLLQELDGRSLSAQTLAEVDRLRRVLAHGERFDSEELVLALTLRVEIAATLHCVAMFVPDLELDVELSDCDSVLEEIANSRWNRENYAIAISLINRNWQRRLPFSFQILGIPKKVGLYDS